MKSSVLALATIALCSILAVNFAPSASAPKLSLVLIPEGRFEMGDHHGFVDPKHGGDESPVHPVHLSSFYLGRYEVTTQEYGHFLNEMAAQQRVEVRDGGVYQTGGNDLLFETRAMSPYSPIGWDGQRFSVLDGKAGHPIVCIRWCGAALFCNWLSLRESLPPCYDTTTWTCDLRATGYRLPTEAEWEYAARGGRQEPYCVFPWGDKPDPTAANWPESTNPFRAGPEPWTTPVGFFDGSLRRKSDFGWPGAATTYQTACGANPLGLQDMAGNVWEFVNDWYGRDYYESSPEDNPTGPERGSQMPDGKAYRGMRGGNWYNGKFGHSRVSNRNPSYWRGPQDPNHPYYHIGFRVARPVSPGAESTRGLSPSISGAPRAESDTNADSGALILSCPAVTTDGVLPSDDSGNGAAESPPLAWSGAPPETKSYAITMHHIAPDQVKWHWVLYNIAPSARGLSRGATGEGEWGCNGINGRQEYAPPRSKGPGNKTFIVTLYALSSPPAIDVPGAQVTPEVFLEAIRGRVLARAELPLLSAGQVDRREMNTPSGREAVIESDQRDILDSLGYLGADSERRDAPPRAAGGAAELENTVPVSPNPGQTLGLFLNTAGASPGYTLFAPKHNTSTYLIDNEGQVVHQWKSMYEPGQTVYLKPDGHLLHCCFTKGHGFTGGGEGGRIEEFDWDGNLVWEFEYSDDTRLSHHDIAPMPNGNILMLVVEKKSYDECIAAGFDPAMLRDGRLYPDSVVEIKPTYPSGGEVVWTWHVWDHLIQERDPALANYGDVSAHPERIDVACNGRPVPAFWNHMNSIDYNAALDQVMLSVRGCNEIWVLDHSTRGEEAAGHRGGQHDRGGDLIYRWGNPSAYDRGGAGDRRLFQQHDARWIPEGYPGAGHITVFNNGYDRGWSSVEELVPPLDEHGRYTLDAGGVYGPSSPVWHFEAADRTDFYSTEISGARRLSNGNTLICEGVVGNLMEVTTEGELVWQYVNPVVRGGVLAQGELPGKDMRGHLWNAVFNVQRYPADYPGLVGRALKALGPIELPASERGRTGLNLVDDQPGEDRRGVRSQGGGNAGPPRRDRERASGRVDY